MKPLLAEFVEPYIKVIIVFKPLFLFLFFLVLRNRPLIFTPGYTKCTRSVQQSGTSLNSLNAVIRSAIDEAIPERTVQALATHRPLSCGST